MSLAPRSRPSLPFTLLLAASLALPSVLAPPPLAAQDDAAIEEAAEGSAFDDAIVVTARRREEDPQTIPIALTTFSTESIEALSMEDLSDVADWAPNVNFTVGGGFSDQNAEATVFIRGVGQIDTAIFSDPAVGIYVDGVYLARSQGAVFDLLDLERIEVLRGPQGTLFGKNTTGGALSLITRKPTPGFEARLGATVGEYDRIDFKGRVGGRLAPELDATLALISTQRDGFARSLESGQEFHDDDQRSARLALRWSPSDSVLFDLAGDYSVLRESTANQVLLSLVDTPLLDFLQRAEAAGGFPIYDERWVSPNGVDSFNGLPSFYDSDVYGVAGTWSWTGRDLSLRSISAYRGVEVDSAGDSDGSPIRIAERFQDQRQEQVSQELQLTGLAAGDALTWVLGALYFDESPRETARTAVFADIFPALEAAPGPVVAPPGVPPFLCNPGPPPPGLPCFGGAGNPLNFAFFQGEGNVAELDLETRSLALFGEATWAATETVSLTGGLRWTRDEKTFSYRNTNGFGVVDSDLFNEGDWDAFTPRFSIAWQARPTTLFYTSASRGFKSGGFNGRPQQRQLLDPFDPETVWTYEAGWKTDLLGRRLRLNGAVFTSDYRDIQYAASLDVAGQPVFVTQNAGTARIDGAELELVAQPAVGWTLTTRVGYLDNELTEIDPAVPGGLEQGGRLPKTPEWTLATSVQKAWALAAGERGSLIARADYSYRSEYFNDAANTPAIATDAFGLLHLRALYSPPSSRWDVAVFVTNATDEHYLENGFFAAAFGPNLGIPGRPREWGASFEWRF